MRIVWHDLESWEQREEFFSNSSTGYLAITKLSFILIVPVSSRHFSFFSSVAVSGLVKDSLILSSG